MQNSKLTIPSKHARAKWKGEAITGVASLAGTAINARMQKKENERNRQFAVDMMNRQNEYNTPTAQRERLKAAGVNPAVAFGAGGGSNTSASVSPSAMPAPQIDIPSVISSITGMMETLLKRDTQPAEKENIEADTKKKKAETQGQTLTNTWQQLENDFAQKTFDTRADQLRATYEKTLSETNKTDADTQLSKDALLSQATARAHMEAQILKTEAETRNLSTAQQQMLMAIRLLEAQTGTEYKKQYQMALQNKQIEADTLLSSLKSDTEKEIARKALHDATSAGVERMYKKDFIQEQLRTMRHERMQNWVKSLSSIYKIFGD